MKHRTWLFVSMIVALLIVSATPALAHDSPPDIVLINGSIATVNDDFAFVQALAIGGGEILAAGSTEDIQALAVDTTQVIDLNGRTVLPSPIDGHLLALHPDAMHGAPWSPFVNLWYAVNAESLAADGATAHALTREEALRTMTVTLSQLMGGDAMLGSLQPGYHANLVVLSDDYFTIPADDIRFITSELTIVDGMIVYAGGDYADLAMSHDMASMDHDHDMASEEDHDHDMASEEDHDHDMAAADEHEHATDANTDADHEDHEHADDPGAPLPNEGAVVRIISPADGATVSSNDFVVEIETENFTLGADGNHWHVLIDGVEWGMIMGVNTSFVLNGIEPGEHTVEVRLSNGMHLELAEGDAITVTVQ